MNKSTIALLLFTFFLATTAITAQEEPLQNVKEIQAKNDTLVKDSISLPIIKLLFSKKKAPMSLVELQLKDLKSLKMKLLKFLQD